MTTFTRLLSSFVGVAILVCLCLLLPTYLFTKRSIDSRVREGISQRMLMIQNSFEDAYQDSLSSSLQRLVTSAVLDEYLLASEIEKPVVRKGVEKRFVEFVKSGFGFETILYINARGQNEIGVTGNKRMTSPEAFRTEQPDVFKVTNKLFGSLVVKTSGEIVAEGPYRGSNGKILFVAGIAKPDPATGREGGAIIIVVNLKNYFDRLGEIRLFDKNSVWVLSSFGSVLKTPLDPGASFDPGRYLKGVIAKEAKTVKAHEGVLVFQDLFVSPAAPLIQVAITIPYALLLKDVSGAIFFFLGLFFVAILLATVVSFAMSRYLTKPFTALTAAFQNIAQGNFNFRSKIKVSGDLKALIDQFNDMVAQLQQTTVSRDLLLSEIDQRRRVEGSLAQREMTMETITNAAHDAILMIDPAGKISFWNPAAERIFGWTKEEALGRDMHSLLAPARYRESIHKAFPHFQATGQGAAVGKTLELWGLRKDQSEFPLELALSSIKMEDKWHAIGMLRDITERKKSEAAILRDQERQRALLELNQMNDLDPKEVSKYAVEESIKISGSKIGYIAFMNDDESVLTMHYWSNAAMAECCTIDKPIEYPIEKTGLWGEAVRQRKPVITNDYAAPNPLKKGTPDGHVQIERHMNIPVFAGKKIVAVAGLGNKGTDYDEEDVRQLTLMMDGMWHILRHKRAEADGIQQRKFLETILDSLTHPFYVINAKDFTIQLANSFARSLCGNFISGTTCHVLSHHNDKPCGGGDHVCPLEEILRTKASVTVEHLHYDAQGQLKNMEVHGYPIFDGAGNVVQMIEYSIDITERKKTQIELEETHAKLKESVGQLIQAEKLTALGELTAGIAHELNQPLNVTKIICQGILRDIEKNRFSMEEAKSDLPQVVTQMNKMAEIINHMRIFTRITDGSNREKCDLNVVVTDVLRFVTQQYKDHNVELAKNLTDGLPLVLADQVQIEQVCMNLLTNARHALEGTAKQSKRIEIKTGRGPNDTVFIEIIDNGMGIPEKLKVKMFQQFFTTKEPGKGTGLGLSLCRKIIEEHGGTITFESVEGQGTTFRVNLPILKDAGGGGHV